MKLFLILAVLSASPADSQAEKKEIIQKVDAAFNKVRTLNGKFRQVFHNSAIGETEVSGGAVNLKKPLKMLWKYEKPYEQTIISDGKTLFFYLPEEKQVMAEPLGGIINSRSPLLFLAGKNSLTDIFDIELESGPDKVKMGGATSLVLTPKQKSLNITRIVIRVDKKEWLIQSFSLYDWTGNRTDITFSDMAINENADDELFVFKRPKGVEQMEMPRLDFGVE